MASKEYWMLREQNKANKTAKQTIKHIEKVYKQAYKSIDEQMQQVWLEMLTKGEISASSLYNYNRLDRIMDEVDKQLKKLGITTDSNIQQSLMDVYVDAYKSTGRNLGMIDVVMPEHLAESIVNASYKNAVYTTRIYENLGKVRQQIENSIIESAATGRDVRKVSKELANRVGASLSDTKRIVITETDRVLNETCRITALNGGFKSYHLLVESDACDECVGLEGTTFDINEQILPVHPYCKCAMIIDLPE